MRDEYDLASTMRDARARYFELNKFGDNGGYDDAWVDFHLGPLPCPFPNTKSRIRAVKVHDLHHILTGYRTDTRGEFEISAWELGAGCKDFYAAWYLNLGGMGAGLVSCPLRTFRAFIRGRRAQSLYGRPLDDLLGRTVAEMREATNVDAPIGRASLADIALFAALSVVAFTVFALSLPFGLIAIPYGLIASALRTSQRPAAA